MSAAVLWRFFGYLHFDPTARYAFVACAFASGVLASLPQRSTRIRVTIAIAASMAGWSAVIVGTPLTAVILGAGGSVGLAALSAPDSDTTLARLSNIAASAAPLPLTAVVVGSVIGIDHLAVVAPASFGLVVLAPVALGVRPFGGSAGVTLLAVPLTAAATSMAMSGRLTIPTAAVAAAALMLVCAVVEPKWWTTTHERAERLLQPIERVVVAVDRLVDRTDGPRSRVRRAGHWVLASVRRAFQTLGAGVSAVIVFATYQFVVLLPSLVAGAVGWEPGWVARRAGSRWVARQGTELRPESMWSRDLVERRGHHGIVAGRVTVMAIALIAAAVVGVSRMIPDDRSPAADVLSSEPWFAEFASETNRLDRGETFEAFAGIEVPDFSGRYINVTDGWRRTWTPPPPRCGRALRVWMFGGSALWGVGQRDLFTIPSALSRRAWRAGFAVDVRNGAVYGDVAWQEQRRLERALAREDTAPDLVVFYDGYNDLLAQSGAAQVGRGGVGTFMSLNDSDLMPLLTKVRDADRSGEGPIEIDGLDRPGGYDMSPSTVEAAQFQYLTSHEQTRELLSARGIPMVRFFQPSRNTRAVDVAGDRPRQKALTEGLAAFRRGWPGSITDLSAAFDRSPEPVYVDAVHTLEVANPVVAEAMFDQMKGVLRRVNDEVNPSCS